MGGVGGIRPHGGLHRGVLAVLADGGPAYDRRNEPLAEEMARRYATEALTDGELEKAKEGIRNYLKKAVKAMDPGGLSRRGRCMIARPDCYRTHRSVRRICRRQWGSASI